MTSGAFLAGRKPAAASARRWSVRRARLMERAYAGLSRLLPLLAPAMRTAPARPLRTAVTAVEKGVKRRLFGCRMCGECVLNATGMACPMTCPKTLRNGPCGGVRPDGHCEIEPSMRCVWLDAWDGAARMAGGASIAALQPPLDARLAGRSTWLAVMNGEHAPDRAPPDRAAGPGDTVAAAARGAGRLERRLRAGRFCVTAEFNPPDTADPGAILDAAAPLLEACDAVNVTDGAGANTHISSLATCALLAANGYEPVMQVSCRDRNRIAIQADALGAAALGIGNILCLTGDGIEGGDQPGAKPVFDLDCASLLHSLRTMRDDGRFSSGRRIAAPPALFLGATSNPCGIETEIEVNRLAKKIAAGAQFIQTQFCFDPESFKAFFARYRDRGLHERCPLLVGVGPLDSARAARWMRANIAGVRIPEPVIDRLERSTDQRREGLDLCVELIEELRAVDGVAGVHVMAFRRPEAVREIVERARLRAPPRRAASG